MDTNKSKVFRVCCPVCRSVLWVDHVSREVMKSEREQRKKGTLDDLLVQEQKRKSEFERKFEATAELEKEKKKKAQEKFAEAFTKMDSER